MTLFPGIRRCLRECRDGHMEIVRFRQSDDLVLEISPERVNGAAVVTLSVFDDDDLLRTVQTMLVADFAQEGTVSKENSTDGKVQIHFLVPVRRAE